MLLVVKRRDSRSYTLARVQPSADFVHSVGGLHHQLPIGNP